MSRFETNFPDRKLMFDTNDILGVVLYIHFPNAAQLQLNDFNICIKAAKSHCFVIKVKVSWESSCSSNSSGPRVCVCFLTRLRPHVCLSSKSFIFPLCFHFNWPSFHICQDATPLVLVPTPPLLHPPPRLGSQHDPN